MSLGGLRQLRSYVTLTTDTLIPFYIALLVELAGNVDPVRLLTRQCMRPDPIDEDVEWIEWKKRRAGPAGEKIQRRSFPVAKTFGAPHLIQLLLGMTERLVPRVPPADRNRLFLVPHERARTFGVISYGCLTQATRRFLARAAARIDDWNRQHPDKPKPSLPAFALRDLRGSVATQHYIASGGDVRRAQGILNHANAATTDRYIKDPLARDLNARIIGRFQRQLVASLSGRPSNSSETSPCSDGIGMASASFAHDCRDPAARLLPGTSKSGLCPLFQQCLDCPGLVIFIDAEHLARLLLAKEAFEAARERLHPERWKLLYADTYQRIVTNILPKFPQELFPAARALMPSLPRLAPLE